MLIRSEQSWTWNLQGILKTSRVSLDEWQPLTGFSKATDKCLQFFRVLRKAFKWMDECQQAFKDLKNYLALTLLLSPSKPREELYLNLAVSPHVVSSALIKEEGKVQKPVYYTSKALRGAEGWYPPMEKLAFSLVIATRKLRPYFQAHVINVLTNHPLKKAMNNLQAVR